MIQVKTFYFNELRECTYVLWDETNACVVVDPGAETESERLRLQQFIDGHALKPEAILNTHGHFDHVLANAFLARVYGVKSHIHAGDRTLLEKTNEYGAMFGYKIEQPPAVAGFLTEDEPFRFGHSQLQVLHTPGHSKGGVCFYAAVDNFVLTATRCFRETLAAWTFRAAISMKSWKACPGNSWRCPTTPPCIPGMASPPPSARKDETTLTSTS